MSGAARNSSLGSYGERVAAQRLVAQGMVVVDRNWRCDLGEVDLVLRDGDVLVFCEVKTRSSAAYGHPLEAVTPVKLARLRRLAGAWLETHPGTGRRVRIDVVGVVLGRTPADDEISHVRGAGA